MMQKGAEIRLPRKAKFVRIHASGDFFSQEYFDKWLKLCERTPNVHYWAFTKSLPYWIERIERIPPNLVLTASYGGKSDELIEKYGLRYAKVFKHERDVPKGMQIDTDDRHAMVNGPSFALIDNFEKEID
ncbi:MAG: hypothetical protein GX800_08160 [Clostridiaceae bacterium]|nr:hypothetical protein [Clostridiaceae bacterium]